MDWEEESLLVQSHGEGGWAEAQSIEWPLCTLPVHTRPDTGVVLRCYHYWGLVCLLHPSQHAFKSSVLIKLWKLGKCGERDARQWFYKHYVGETVRHLADLAVLSATGEALAQKVGFIPKPRSFWNREGRMSDSERWCSPEGIFRITVRNQWFKNWANKVGDWGGVVGNLYVPSLPIAC